jgi:hypothetical protein
MASTRTKNTPGDYQLEQWSFAQNVGYNTAAHYGRPEQTYLPGDGLLAGNVSRTQLSNNSCDIESMLRGIGANNLVTPRASTVPMIAPLQSLSIMDRIPLLVPAPLVVQSNQRPLRD